MSHYILYCAFSLFNWSKITMKPDMKTSGWCCWSLFMHLLYVHTFCYIYQEQRQLLLICMAEFCSPAFSQRITKAANFPKSFVNDDFPFSKKHIFEWFLRVLPFVSRRHEMALRNTLDFGSTAETKIRSEKVGTEKVVPHRFPGFGAPVQTYDDAKGKPEQI